MFNEYNLLIPSGASETSTFVLGVNEFIAGVKTNTLATSGFLRVKSSDHVFYNDGAVFSIPVASGQFHALDIGSFTALRTLSFEITSTQSQASILTLITREI